MLGYRATILPDLYPMSLPLLNTLPPKAASSDRVRRRLVYLDQNILTHLAKIDLGRDLPDDLKAATQELREAIRISVCERQDAICVESIFHREESSGLVIAPAPRDGAKELFHQISQFLTYNSFGLSFSGRTDLLRTQTLTAIAQDLGIETRAPENLWRVAFSHDPQKSNEDAGVTVGGSLFVIGAEWVPRTYQQVPWADNVERMRRDGKFPNFKAALEVGKQERRTSISRQNEMMSWGEYWSALPRDWIPRKEVDRFIASDSLFQVPILYTQIHLYADVLSERTRVFRDSDPNDLDILSVAIPYCDLVVTDKYMAGIVKKRGLDKALGCTVLPASPKGISEAAAYLLSPS